MNAPCWNCKKRLEGCHSECADYKIFRCEVQAIREYERKFFSSIDSKSKIATKSTKEGISKKMALVTKRCAQCGEEMHNVYPSKRYCPRCMK